MKPNNHDENQPAQFRGGGGGEGGVLWYFHTYVGSGHLLNFNIFWGIQKNKFFLGYDDLWIFLFAAFEAANFQIDFFGNPVMRTAE